MPAYIRIVADKNHEEVFKMSSKNEAVTFTDNFMEFTPPVGTFEYSFDPKYYTLKLNEGVAMPLEGEGCGSAAAEGTISVKGRIVF